MGCALSSSPVDTQEAHLPRISVRQGEHSSGVDAATTSARIPACKVVLLGNTAAGKTSLLSRFARDHWDPSTCSTIGAAFSSHVVDLHDGRSLEMAVWDTAGQERYRTLAPLYYRNANAAVVVFDVTSKESFDGSRLWVGDFLDHRPGTCVILVGNKTDLEGDRCVTQEGAKAFATAKGLLYIETSAKDNKCVAETFELVAASVLDKLAPST